MDINFQTYTFWDMPETWITLGIGGFLGLTLLITAVVLCVKYMRKNKDERDYQSTAMSIFFIILIFLTLSLSLGAYLSLGMEYKAKGETRDAAIQATQAEIQEIYGLDITDAKVPELIGQYNVRYLENPPKEDVFTFGTTNTLVNGEVIPLTLASVNGEIQLLTGEDTLKELPKKN